MELYLNERPIYINIQQDPTIYVPNLMIKNLEKLSRKEGCTQPRNNVLQLKIKWIYFPTIVIH